MAKKWWEVIAALNKLTDDDPEISHSKADDILLKHLRAIGHCDIADAYEEAKIRIGFWYA